MAEVLSTFIGVVFLFAFLVVYITAFAVLKPFNVHKKRKVSTLSLKISYMVYLAMYLFFLYIIMFNTSKLPGESFDDAKLKFYLAVFLIISIFPNLGIILRRKFKKKRIEYNFLFATINILTSLLMLFLMTNEKWGIV